MMFAAQLLKMAAIASFAALLAVHWLSPLDSALVGVVAFYLLLVRVS